MFTSTTIAELDSLRLAAKLEECKYTMCNCCVARDDCPSYRNGTLCDESIDIAITLAGIKLKLAAMSN